MNLTGMRNTFTRNTLNRYRLAVPSCSADIDVEDFRGEEAMSALYRYTIRFTSTNKNIDARQLLTKPATLTMGAGNLLSLADRKVVHGVITHFTRTGGSADEAKYSIVLEPFIALLANQFRTHRFFVNKSVPEVVAEVLREHNLNGWEYEFILSHDYPKREQINQYQENDLAFIERLLAELGIFYFFSLHPETQTEVVHFADRQSAWSFGKKLPLNSPSGANDNGADSVWDVQVTQNVAVRSVTAGDYNHREAQRVLLSEPADMTRGDGEGVTWGDVYHHRPRHQARGDNINPEPETGHFWARLEHERFLSDQTRVTGSSTDHSLGPAQVLVITEAAIPPTLPQETENGVVITRAVYTASRQNALQVAWSAMPFFENRCWRPAARPRPVVSGTLMARVTSAKPDDIYAWQDASGLYRVKFDADRDDKRKGMESMPVRLAKPYGGHKYGFHFPLVQGTEVAIAFHEGDPDRPYIAHALHDSRHIDPVTELNSTRNVVRTAGRNKLRMEDKRGAEHVKLSTEYGGKTQLNLGHNVNAERKPRGEGAELRTDRHVAIRGGAGVFITADKQPSASGMMMEMSAALSQLQKAQGLVESLNSAAQAARAELADLQTQKQLLNETLAELKNAALLLSAPDGIAQVTPKTLQLSAGENITAVSGGSTDFSILKKMTVAAGERISLYAQKLGIKLFASKGKVEIQAQGDEMTLDALKDVRVSSSEGKIIISAKQEIILTSGGGYIRIADGTVECSAPDKIIERGAVWQKFSGQSASQMFNQYQQGNFKLQPLLVWEGTGDAVVNRKATVSSDMGSSVEKTSVNGNATMQNFNVAGGVDLTLYNEDEE